MSTTSPKPNLGSAQLPRDAYTCPELGRTCMRPGAYDAHALPSLIAGERRYPDGRVERVNPITGRSPRP